MPQDAGDYVCQISDGDNRDQIHTVEILGEWRNAYNCMEPFISLELLPACLLPCMRIFTLCQNIYRKLHCFFCDVQVMQKSLCTRYCCRDNQVAFALAYIIIIIIIIIIRYHFMQVINDYIAEKNHVYRVYSVVGIVKLQCMAYVLLFPKLSAVCFYTCTFRSLLLLLLLLLLLFNVVLNVAIFVIKFIRHFLCSSVWAVMWTGHSPATLRPLSGPSQATLRPLSGHSQTTLRPAHIFSPVRNWFI
jgi:hypothetical protein